MAIAGRWDCCDGAEDEGEDDFMVMDSGEAQPRRSEAARVGMRTYRDAAGMNQLLKIWFCGAGRQTGIVPERG